MLNPFQHDIVLQAARNCIEIEAQVVADLKIKFRIFCKNAFNLSMNAKAVCVVTGIKICNRRTKDGGNF